MGDPVTGRGRLDDEAGLDDRRQQRGVGSVPGDDDQRRAIALSVGEATDEAGRITETRDEGAGPVADLAVHRRQHARHHRVGSFEHGHAAALGGRTHGEDDRVAGPRGDEPAGARAREAVGEHVGDRGAGHHSRAGAVQRANASNTGRIRSSALRRLASELAYDRRR